MNQSNKIYIYPTDTVWGLGCSIYSKNSVKKIIKKKNIKKNRPFSILFHELSKIKEYFSFPSCMNDEWPQRFFELQSAMALPLFLKKKDIPSWITADSSYVAIRLQSFSGIKAIIDEVQAPIITTSLNFSGENTICKKDLALAFHQKHMPDFHFIDDDIPCSGLASTIVAWENNEIKFWRLGQKADQIHRLCLEILPERKIHFAKNICK